MFVAVTGVSVPSMTLGPLLVLVFALKLKVLPVAQWGSWQQVVLPAFTLGFGSAAILARLTRASMLQVLREDYIRTARAKGLAERSVVLRHTIKNAMIPVLTVMGPLAVNLVTGSFIVETMFSIPGVGRETINAVSARDYNTIMGTTLFYAFIVTMASLVVDLAYAVVDPRIRYR